MAVFSLSPFARAVHEKKSGEKAEATEADESRGAR